MSKRYSLFKGAGAASIRRLGVLLAMLLTAAWYSVSYADAGFFTDNAWNLRIYRGGSGDEWIHFNDQGNNPECADFKGAGNTESVGNVDLGEVDQLYLKRSYANTWDTWNGETNDEVTAVWMQYKVDNADLQSIQLNNRGCDNFTDDGNKAWSTDCDINILNGLSSGTHTLYVRYVANTSFAADRWMPGSGDGDWFEITFTIPQQGPVFNPSETTMYFGNVPYGESKESTVHFEYNGSTPLSGNTEDEAGINDDLRGSFFEFVGIGNDGTDGWITYRFHPDETNSNKSFTNTDTNDLKCHRITLTKDDETLTVIFNASSFTPLIAGSREPVRAQSKAELSGAIVYTGCNVIEEYGVYYSTDPDFFDSATNTVDMSKSQVANVTGVTIEDPDDPEDPDDDLKVTVDGLMSGTTYYYIWYMKDSDGQTTFDAVLNFTTNEGDYRLAVNDAVAGTETYYGFIYKGEIIGGSNDITTGYVQYWLSCTPRQTYRLQFNYMHEDWTYEWIDVPGQSGTIPSTFSQSYVRIEGTDLVKNNSEYVNAKLSTPVLKEVPAEDYTYNVYFTNADGSAVTGNDGSDLVMTVTGVESATIKGGQSGTFVQFPKGSQYRVERVYKNQPDVACEIGSGHRRGAECYLYWRRPCS